MTEDELMDQSTEYETLLINLESSITFKNKSLAQWSQELSIPVIGNGEEPTQHELEVLNTQYINLTEIVYSNLAIAKSSSIVVNSYYERILITKKRNIEEARELANARKLSAESLNNQAFLQCEQEFNNKIRSECLLQFWESQAYKLKNLNDRLTSLHISKRSY